MKRLLCKQIRFQRRHINFPQTYLNPGALWKTSFRKAYNSREPPPEDDDEWIDEDCNDDDNANKYEKIRLPKNQTTNIGEIFKKYKIVTENQKHKTKLSEDVKDPPNGNENETENSERGPMGWQTTPSQLLDSNNNIISQPQKFGLAWDPELKIHKVATGPQSQVSHSSADAAQSNATPQMGELKRSTVPRLSTNGFTDSAGFTDSTGSTNSTGSTDSTAGYSGGTLDQVLLIDGFNPVLTVEETLALPQFSNWIRLSLCLRYVCQALQPWIDGVLKELHNSLILDLDNGTNIHGSKSDRELALEQIYVEMRKKDNRVKYVNKSNGQQLKQTLSELCIGPMEMAKVFMNMGKAYKENQAQNADDFDSSGLSSLIRNCEAFRTVTKELESDIKFWISVRNSLMHNPKQQVSDEEYVSAATGLLNFVTHPKLKSILSESAKYKSAIDEMSKLCPPTTNKVDADESRLTSGTSGTSSAKRRHEEMYESEIEEGIPPIKKPRI